LFRIEFKIEKLLSFFPSKNERKLYNLFSISNLKVKIFIRNKKDNYLFLSLKEMKETYNNLSQFKNKITTET
jgi:hypothetical protein